MNPFELIRQDHERATRLLERIRTDRDPRARQTAFDDLKRELDLHTDVEEKVFYPEIEKRVPALRDFMRRAREEHRAVAGLLRELQATPVASPEWATKLRTLAQSVRDHIEEEEGELFPQAQRALDAAQVQELGRQLEDFRSSVLEEWKIALKGAAEKVVDSAKKVTR